MGAILVIRSDQTDTSLQKPKQVYKIDSKSILSENILWYSSFHDFHMLCYGCPKRD